MLDIFEFETIGGEGDGLDLIGDTTGVAVVSFS
jgi:hypothetical protein